jgi:hypothetical protein
MATKNQWTAYRYPTTEEIDAGCKDWDVIEVGKAGSKSEARKLLWPLAGQIQEGPDGEVENVDAGNPGR